MANGMAHARAVHAWRAARATAPAGSTLPAMRIVAGMDDAGYGPLLGPSPRRLRLKLKARRAPATTHTPPSAGALGGVECGRRPRPALALLKKARCVGNVLRAPGGTLVADEVRP